MRRTLSIKAFHRLERACANDAARRIRSATRDDVDLLGAVKTGGDAIVDFQGEIGQAIKNVLRQYGWEFPEAVVIQAGEGFIPRFVGDFPSNPENRPD